MIVIKITATSKYYEQETIDKIVNVTLDALETIGSEVLSAEVDHNGVVVDILDKFKKGE